MRTLAAASVVVPLLFVSAGCSAEPEKPSRAAKSGASKPTDTGTSEPAPPAKPDPFATAPAHRPYAMNGAPTVLAAGDGTRLLVYEPAWSGRERTTYRLYNDHWRPLTPLLSVSSSLVAELSTQHGFVAHVYRSRPNGTMLYDGWATIDRRGRIREAPTRAKPPHRVNKGDLPVGSDDPGRWVYRPASGSILRVKTPGWDSRRQTWHLGGSTVCAMPDSRPELMHVSTDSGRSFRPVPLAGLVPPGGGRVVGCRVTPTGMLLEAVEENPAWLHTVDPDRGNLISSRRLGVELDPWNWDTLADGRLVAATNRPGIMVATDPSNREMRFRPGPVPVGVGFTLLDDEITLVRRHVVHVSRDDGLTWLVRDLQLP